MLKPKCPSCEKPGNALTANPHCANKDCDWNKCHCGATYSRKTGGGYTHTPETIHYAPRK